MISRILIYISATFLIIACGRKPVREFHLEPEPVRLDIKLYADSTFEETMQELEGTYEYSGRWQGCVEEGGVFHLYLVDSINEIPIFLNHGSYRIKNGEILKWSPEN